MEGKPIIFPNLIVEIRRNKYCQKKLGEYIGVTESCMSRKMCGKSDFTYSEMRKIQECFPNCTLDYLFTEYGAEE